MHGKQVPCYAGSMESRLHRLIYTGVVLALITTIASFTFGRYLEQLHYKTTLERQAIELREAQSQVSVLSKDLAANTSALLATQKSLDKVNADLADKTKQLDTATQKIKDQQSQISSNSSELSKLRDRPPLFSFSVESNSITDVEQKKQDIKKLVTDAYEVIEEIYGKPYLLHSATIVLGGTFANDKASAEITISNSADGLSITIKLKDFDKNDFNDVQAVVHELGHAVKGLATLSPVAYEEGETVAMTDAVLELLIARGKIPSFKPLYIRLSASDYASSSLTVPADTAAFYSSGDVAKYYQLVGYGWYQLYKADSNFFKNFNESIYDQKRNGNEITGDVVRTTIEDVMHKNVSGKSVSDWLKTKAFALGN